MTLDLDTIPDSDAPASGGPGIALSDLPSVRPGRRGVLKGVALSGMTLGATALTWGSAAAPAVAETSPSGLDGWDRNDCSDAYPRGYREQRDNTGQYRNIAGACFGGSAIGSDNCDADGWHRVDSVGSTTYRPVSGSCSGKNAWKWTVDGVTYRCSDGRTTEPVFWIWTRSYLSIGRAAV